MDRPKYGNLRPFEVHIDLIPPTWDESAILKWISSHHLPYISRKLTKSKSHRKLILSISYLDKGSWEDAQAGPSTAILPSMEFQFSKPTRQSSNTTTTEYVIRGLATGRADLSQKLIQEQLTSSLKQSTGSDGPFLIRKLLEAGASRMAFFSSPTDLVLPRFIYHSGDGCRIEPAGAPQPPEDVQNRTVLIGNLQGHQRVAANLESIRQDIGASEVSVPGYYDTRNAVFSRGSTAHFLFDTREAAVAYTHKHSSIDLSGQLHPIRLMCHVPNSRTSYCWRCWESGHHSTSCPNPHFGSSGNHPRLVDTRRAQDKRETQQYAVGTLPANRIKAVKNKIIKAMVMGDNSRLPENPVTYALVAQKALADHPMPVGFPKPPPTAPSTAAQKQPNKEETTLARLVTVLDTLVSRMENIETRLAVLEQPQQGIVPPSNPNVLSVIEKTLETLGRQLAIMDQKVQKLELPRPSPFAPSASQEFDLTMTGDSQQPIDTDTGPEQWPVDYQPTRGVLARRNTPPTIHRSEIKMQQQVKKYFTKGKAPA